MSQCLIMSRAELWDECCECWTMILLYDTMYTKSVRWWTERAREMTTTRTITLLLGDNTTKLTDSLGSGTFYGAFEFLARSSCPATPDCAPRSCALPAGPSAAADGWSWVLCSVEAIGWTGTGGYTVWYEHFSRRGMRANFHKTRKIR